jgi:hypothetical protein
VTGARWTALSPVAAGKPGFELMSAHKTSIDFTNILVEFSGATNRILHNGSGA